MPPKLFLITYYDLSSGIEVCEYKLYFRKAILSVSEENKLFVIWPTTWEWKKALKEMEKFLNGKSPIIYHDKYNCGIKYKLLDKTEIKRLLTSSFSNIRKIAKLYVKFTEMGNRERCHR